MGNFEGIAPMSLRDAHDFSVNSGDQLTNIIVGEADAVEAVKLVLATGGNAMLFGYPGGAKSKLAMHVHGLIEGIDEEDVAHVPVQADLQPREVVGGEARTRKVTTGVGGEPWAEESIMEIEAFIKPNTKVVLVDEANRVGPAAMNTLLEVFENGVVRNNTGLHSVDVQYGIGTMNPAGNRFNTYDMDPAFASRHLIGVELANRHTVDPATRHQNGRAILDLRRKGNVAISPVIDLKELKSLQALVNGTDRTIDLPDNMADELVTRVNKANDVLGQLGIHEGDGRMLVQADILSRGVAALRGEAMISPDHIKRAIRYIIGGRIGIIGTRTGSPVSAVELTEDVYRNA